MEGADQAEGRCERKVRFMTQMMLMWMFGVPLTVVLLLKVFGMF